MIFFKNQLQLKLLSHKKDLEYLRLQLEERNKIITEYKKENNKLKIIEKEKYKLHLRLAELKGEVKV